MALIFDTKAKTLEKLTGKLEFALVPQSLRVNYGRWLSEKDLIVQQTIEKFGNAKLAVRSSFSGEDSIIQSLAGSFISILNVNPEPREIEHAINAVFASYRKSIETIAVHEEIFIQSMLRPIVSGVLFTRRLDDGAPYYIFNYDDESGQSDTVTSGSRISKTVYMHRSVNESQVNSARLVKMLKLARELETIFDCDALDIEFLIDEQHTMHLLQVRPLANKSKWLGNIDRYVDERLPILVSQVKNGQLSTPGILGERTIYANMPDWNPAELIGARPKPLAISLFKKLISNTIWHSARSKMGYRYLCEQNLLEVISDHVYVDVRLSFNSFLPAGLSDAIGEKLVNYWIEKLSEKPYLHDKIEFEVAYPSLDFSFSSMVNEYSKILSSAEIDEWKSRLLEMTCELISVSGSSNLKQSIYRSEYLFDHFPTNDKSQPTHTDQINFISALLKAASAGSEEFCIQARHGFIAESLLRSLEKNNALKSERITTFRRSLKTITHEMMEDIEKVYDGVILETDFISKYGHLRPGTFDIEAKSLKHRKNLVSFTAHNAHRMNDVENFTLSTQERAEITNLILENGFSQAITPEVLIEYMKAAICARERSKFIFTKYLSTALDQISLLGQSVGISDEQLSFVELDQLLSIFSEDKNLNINQLIKVSEFNEREREINSYLQLGYFIQVSQDVYIVPAHRSEPTFITKLDIEADVIHVNANSTATVDLRGKIVCIENADPGFDWIFSRGIVGLITKFGGSNSHMAIRCSELGIPSAIGCGEQVFAKLETAKSVLLHCQSKIINIVD